MKQLLKKLSFRFALTDLRADGAVFEEYGWSWWSPYRTTRLYPDGKIEPVYGGEWFQD